MKDGLKIIGAAFYFHHTLGTTNPLSNRQDWRIA